MMDMGRRILLTKSFDLDLRMIELCAKIGTLRMGQKGDITLDLPDYGNNGTPDISGW